MDPPGNNPANNPQNPPAIGIIDEPVVAQPEERDPIGPLVNVNLRLPPPDTYDGERDAAKLRTWLFTFNQYASLHGLNDGQKIYAAAMFLRGPAANWWEN